MSALPLTRERAREHLGIQNAEQTIAILIGADTKTVKIGEAAQWATVLQQVRKQYPTARLLLTTHHEEHRLLLKRITAAC